MRKAKLFFSVTDADSANAAIKIAYQFTFILAAAQVVVRAFLFWPNPALAEVFGDALFMVSLGLVLRNRPSRFAALILFVYSIFIVYLTFATRVGIFTGGGAGGNIVMAVFLLFAGYKGVQGTFGFHKVHNTKTSIKSVLYLSVIISGYIIGITGIYIGAMFIPQLQSAFDNMSDLLTGSLWLILVIPVIFLGTLGLLPGTKNIKVVQSTDKIEQIIT